MSGPRWLAALTLAILVIITGDVRAQAFKPRGATKAAPAKGAKKAPAASRTTATPRRVVTSKKAKASSSDADPDEPTAKPKAKAKTKGKASRDDDDDVIITDDDE